MPLLRDLMDERGLSAADVAAILTEHGVVKQKGKSAGMPYNAVDVNRRSGLEVIWSWRGALGLEDPAGGRGGRAAAPESSTPPAGRQGEQPPVKPDEAQYAIPIEPGARKRIAGAYKFAGAMLATGTGSEGVAEVWSDSSDKIAELWVAAAQENPWAARFVEVMNSGGAAGDLVAAHIYLVGGTLYVLGARIPAGDTIFSKYNRHRPVEPKPKQGAEANGSSGEAVDAAAGAVADG